MIRPTTSLCWASYLGSQHDATTAIYSVNGFNNNNNNDRLTAFDPGQPG